MYQGQVWARGDFLDRIPSDFDVSLDEVAPLLTYKQNYPIITPQKSGFLSHHSLTLIRVASLLNLQKAYRKTGL
jgi:hypothetical protein